MKSTTVSSLQQLHEAFAPYVGNPLAIFRGQGHSEWELIPKVGRAPFSDIEDDALFSGWQSEAIQFLDPRPSHLLEWLAVAQHHGLATRLLDWSSNPMVAAFFAVWQDQAADAAIYCFCHDGAVVPEVFQQFPPLNEKNVFVWAPDSLSERISRQGAVFTVHSPASLPLYVLNDFESLHQIIIPESYRVRLRQELAFYGFTRSKLFPDLDGLAEHHNWNIRNESNFDAHMGEDEAQNPGDGWLLFARAFRTAELSGGNLCSTTFCKKMKRQAISVIALFSTILTGCKKSSSNQSKTVIPQYRDDWKLVEVRPPESDEIWMFRKNLGVSEIKGLKALPTLVYFTVQFAPKDSSGLPSKEDAKLLYDFEEEAIPKVEKDAECVLVASVVKGGVKDHLFYVSDADLFMQTLNAQRSALSDFKVSLEKHDDPLWAIYDDFPGGD